MLTAGSLDEPENKSNSFLEHYYWTTKIQAHHIIKSLHKIELQGVKLSVENTELL